MSSPAITAIKRPAEVIDLTGDDGEPEYKQARIDLTGDDDEPEYKQARVGDEDYAADAAAEEEEEEEEEKVAISEPGDYDMEAPDNYFETSLGTVVRKFCRDPLCKLVQSMELHNRRIELRAKCARARLLISHGAPIFATALTSWLAGPFLADVTALELDARALLAETCNCCRSSITEHAESWPIGLRRMATEEEPNFYALFDCARHSFWGTSESYSLEQLGEWIEAELPAFAEDFTTEIAAARRTVTNELVRVFDIVGLPELIVSKLCF